MIHAIAHITLPRSGGTHEAVTIVSNLLVDLREVIRNDYICIQKLCSIFDIFCLQNHS